MRIIDLMNEFSLSSLLKRGTKTWHGGGQNGDYESTIDLVLASENLTQFLPWRIFQQKSFWMLRSRPRGVKYGVNGAVVRAVLCPCPDCDSSRRHPVGRHGAAENRPAHVRGVGGGACFNAEGQTVATRKAMVDGRPNTTPSDLLLFPYCIVVLFGCTRGHVFQMQHLSPCPSL
jgi:hypothetical protein